MYKSELYNSPAFFDAPIPSGDRGYPGVTGAKKLIDLHNAWFSDDPFALPGEEKGKLAVLKDAEKWSANLGYPGPANPAEGEVFATFVLPNMMANAARGMKAELAVEQGRAPDQDHLRQVAQEGTGRRESLDRFGPEAGGIPPFSRAHSNKTRKAAATMGCVEIRGISKLFGTVRAVDQVDLATNEGSSWSSSVPRDAGRPPSCG